MMRDTISPTMLTAGVRANVIPAEARANLNIRLLPGDTIDVLLAELTKLVNDPQIKFEVQPDAGLAAPPSSLESDFYATISKVAGAGIWRMRPCCRFSPLGDGFRATCGCTTCRPTGWCRFR